MNNINTTEVVACIEKISAAYYLVAEQKQSLWKSSLSSLKKAFIW